MGHSRGSALPRTTIIVLRLIIFDRLGLGLSDPADLDTLTLERWIDDTTAVMDACSSDRAVLVGTCKSGTAQILFSATHPARTAGLVLMNAGHVGAAQTGTHGDFHCTRRSGQRCLCVTLF